MKRLLLALAILVSTISVANADYVTIAGDVRDPRYKTLVTWFENDPCVEITRETHFNAIPSTHPAFETVTAGSTLPLVRVQADDGTVLKEWSGDGLTWSSQALCHGLRNVVRGRYRDGECPFGKCPVGPEKPDELPKMPRTDAPPYVAPRSKQVPWLLLGGLSVLGALAGIGIQWRRTHK